MVSTVKGYVNLSSITQTYFSFSYYHIFSPPHLPFIISFSIFENVIISLSLLFSKAICITWFPGRPGVCFLWAFWGQYHQILLNLVQLSNPPSVPLISAPRPFSQPADLVFCSISLLHSCTKNYLKKKKKNPLTRFPFCVEEHQKSSLWHDMKSDSFWWNFCMCQPSHSDHVIWEHICSCFSASDTSLKRKSTNTAIDGYCIVFSCSRSRYQWKLPADFCDRAAHQQAEQRG